MPPIRHCHSGMGLLTRKAAWPLLLSAILIGQWVFPCFWYVKTPARSLQRQPVLILDSSLWSFRSQPLSSAIEKRLEADHLVNGQFTKGATSVTAFAATQEQPQPNQIGLFVHTPDRCWTEAGWTLAPLPHEHISLSLPHGQSLPVERRLFHKDDHFELVYFFGWLDGAPLPFRLDHNRSVAGRAPGGRDTHSFLQRLVDPLLWTRIRESFIQRRRMSGTKAFLRLSTACHPSDLQLADRRMQDFIRETLLWPAASR